jgi:phosphatidylserine/phosphatidylglycerophosphate/cardiolipin synthase-like enzyme
MKWTPFILAVFLLISACQPTQVVIAEPVDVVDVTEAPAEQPVAEPVVSSFDLKEIPLEIGYGVDGGWYELYFTDPTHPDAKYYRGGPDTRLAEAIDAARLSVDVAVYSFSLWSIRDALLDALRRGVQVRVVMESDNRDRDVPQELIDAGISVLGDRREGLMHDKFVIIDRTEVWVGSMNFTIGGGYLDNNNLLRIRSQKLVENYQTEFDEMFVGDHFGPDTVSDTPNPVTFVNGTMIETYFSPDDGVAEKLVELLQDAQKSIYFMAYSFTSDDISYVIRERASNGVEVAGVMDYSQMRSNQGGEFDIFAQSGLDVKLGGLDGLMHHKVFIIDEQIVVTGSYNFSRSAEERNDENIIIIYNTDIAQEFIKEFERVQAQIEIEQE